MAVCRLRLAQGLVKYGGHLIDFRGGSRPPGLPRTPPGVKISKKCIFVQNLSGTKGGQIWSPTLEILEKSFVSKNDPPPLGALKNLPKDQFDMFQRFKKYSIRCPKNP